MGLQLIKDGYGNNTGIFVPIKDWDAIIQKHQDLKKLIELAPPDNPKLSTLAGKLSKQTTDEMVAFVAEGRNEWEQRFNEQF